MLAESISANVQPTCQDVGWACRGAGRLWHYDYKRRRIGCAEELHTRGRHADMFRSKLEVADIFAIVQTRVSGVFKTSRRGSRLINIFRLS